MMTIRQHGHGLGALAQGAIFVPASVARALFVGPMWVASFDFLDDILADRGMLRKDVCVKFDS
jgi:hypothetical protein